MKLPQAPALNCHRLNPLLLPESRGAGSPEGGPPPPWSPSQMLSTRHLPRPCSPSPCGRPSTGPPRAAGLRWLRVYPPPLPPSTPEVRTSRDRSRHWGGAGLSKCDPGQGRLFPTGVEGGQEQGPVRGGAGSSATPTCTGWESREVLALLGGLLGQAERAQQLLTQGSSRNSKTKP